MATYGYCWQCSLYFLAPVTLADALAGTFPAVPDLRKTHDEGGNDTTPAWEHGEDHKTVFAWD